MALSDKDKKRLKVALGSPQDESPIVDRIDRAAADVADVADPTMSDAEENSNKINEILAALRAAGLME